MKSLIIEVAEIEGNCPVYKVGDKIILNEGYKIDLSRTNAICMHSIASIMPYYVALSNGVNPKNLGLAKLGSSGKSAFVQCLDPCKYTGGGTVYFEIISI